MSGKVKEAVGEDRRTIPTIWYKQYIIEWDDLHR